MNTSQGMISLPPAAQVMLLAYTHKHVVLQLLDSFVKEVQLECHLVRLVVEQVHIRVVYVGMDENNVFGLNPYELG